MSSNANMRQVGGDLYQGHACPFCSARLQHWDLIEIFDLDPYQYNITKYVLRHTKKGGLQDLKKAQHHLQKYIEVLMKHEDNVQAIKAGAATRSYVDQD